MEGKAHSLACAQIVSESGMNTNYQYLLKPINIDRFNNCSSGGGLLNPRHTGNPLPSGNLEAAAAGRPDIL
jgi:hypothetical protein